MASRNISLCFTVLVMLIAVFLASVGDSTPTTKPTTPKKTATAATSTTTTTTLPPTTSITTTTPPPPTTTTTKVTPKATVTRAKAPSVPTVNTKASSPTSAPCTGPACRNTDTKTASVTDLSTTVSPACVDINCGGHGTCRANSATGYKCHCDVGYDGSDCDIKSLCSSQPCHNGGTCSGNTTYYSCKCQSNYSGDDCSGGTERMTTFAVTVILSTVFSTILLV